MLYSDFITKLRAEAKDLARPMHNDFTGDGSTTLFATTDSPILEGSYIVKVDGTQKTEGLANDYTIDLELGLITFATAPANGKAVTIDFKYVHLTNASWITIINRVLNDMEGEFFKEITDDSFGNTVADSIKYNAPTGCIDVVNFWYKTSNSADLNWNMVIEESNWRYSKDENIIHLGTPFHVSTYPLKLHYLAGYTKGTLISDTLDIQSKYEGVLQLGCMWRYYDYRLADKVNLTTKIEKERTVTPLQNIQALSQHYYKLYLKEKGRKKPAKPMRDISAINVHGGRP